MSVITTTLRPTGLWSPVEITLTNTYSNRVNMNGAIVSFLHPNTINGAPWGIKGVESIGGSLSALATPFKNLQKTQITLHWPYACMLNPGQSIKIAFTSAGEVRAQEFTELRTDLVEDPTAPLSFFIKAPEAPIETSEEAKVIIVLPSGSNQEILVPFGEKKEIPSLFEGEYFIQPQPVKIDNATYCAQQCLIHFVLSNKTNGHIITWNYKEPEYTVPVEFVIPPISYENITTIMYINAEKHLIRFGSTYTANLTANKIYNIQFDTAIVNNTGFVFDRLTYTPQIDKNIINLNSRLIDINTSTFISVNLRTTGIPNSYEGQPQIVLKENGGDNLTYIFHAQVQQNIPVGLVKPGTYKVDAQNLIFNKVRYKFIGKDAITITSSSNQIEVDYHQGLTLAVRGWPAHLAHGGITFNSNEELAQYEKISIECIFKYAGVNGSGDRGIILDPDEIATHTTIQHARSIASKQNYQRIIMPTMVFYTADFSGGIDDKDLKDNELVKIHYINLITELQVAQSYKNDQYPVPCTYIMNPDFLGMIQQNRGISAIIQDLFQPGSICVNDQLIAAISSLGLPVSLPKRFEDNIFGYIQSINWIMRHFGPDVVFGWQCNIWQDSNAYWAYQRPDQTHIIANRVADFIDEMKVYKGEYTPDFIVFDRYERDDFSPDALSSYAWGAKSWKRYLQFVNIVSERVRSPAMLWQIPGSHMPNKQEGSSLVTNGHAGSGGSFFMGDITIGSNLNNIHKSLLNLHVSNPYYYASTVGGILAQDNSHDWSQQALPKAIDSNVFAILWGGGRTTGLISSLEPGTDPVWLANKVNAYYTNPIPLV